MPGGLFGDGEALDVAAVDTAGWVTYSNPKFGYSFKYPPAWTVHYDNDNTDSLRAQGRWSFPWQAVAVLAPEGRCPSHECNAIQPEGLSVLVQVSDVRCAPSLSAPLLSDLVWLASLKAERCLYAYDNDPGSRMLSQAMDFPYTDADSPFSFVVTLEHGSAAITEDRAVLGAILASLAFSEGTIDLEP